MPFLGDFMFDGHVTGPYWLHQPGENITLGLYYGRGKPADFIAANFGNRFGRMTVKLSHARTGVPLLPVPGRTYPPENVEGERHFCTFKFRYGDQRALGIWRSSA